MKPLNFRIIISLGMAASLVAVWMALILLEPEDFNHPRPSQPRSLTAPLAALAKACAIPGEPVLTTSLTLIIAVTVIWIIIFAAWSLIRHLFPRAGGALSSH